MEISFPWSFPFTHASVVLGKHKPRKDTPRTLKESAFGDVEQSPCRSFMSQVHEKPVTIPAFSDSIYPHDSRSINSAMLLNFFSFYCSCAWGARIILDGICASELEAIR